MSRRRTRTNSDPAGPTPKFEYRQYSVLDPAEGRSRARRPPRRGWSECPGNARQPAIMTATTRSVARSGAGAMTGAAPIKPSYRPFADASYINSPKPIPTVIERLQATPRPHLADPDRPDAAGNAARRAGFAAWTTAWHLRARVEQRTPGKRPRRRSPPPAGRTSAGPGGGPSNSRRLQFAPPCPPGADPRGRIDERAPRPRHLAADVDDCSGATGPPSGDFDGGPVVNSSPSPRGHRGVRDGLTRGEPPGMPRGTPGLASGLPRSVDRRLCCRPPEARPRRLAWTYPISAGLAAADLPRARAIIVTALHAPTPGSAQRCTRVVPAGRMGDAPTGPPRRPGVARACDFVSHPAGELPP
jgi:hypothetical protein